MAPLHNANPARNIALLLILLVKQSHGWISSLPRSCRPQSQLFAVLPDNYQEIGTNFILEAGKEVGAKPGQLDIEWKSDVISVIVRGDNVYVSDPSEEEDATEDGDEGDTAEDAPPSPSVGGGVDVTLLARAINVALDDGDGVGFAIAEHHSIEVSTPGATNELSGVMFESYKGFDVTVEHKDPKKESVKKFEGRLVERNDEFTVVNIKGRMKKLKNQDVVSVTLPKAKREKGGR